MTHGVRILAGMISMVLLGSASSIAAPVQWAISDGGNGHWYEAVPSTLWWSDAMAAASDSQWLGIIGHLATVTSQAEHDWILQNVGQHSAYWLGGYQDPWDESQPMANWHWVTGEPWAYTNWYSGEPNDEGPSGSEFYLNTTSIDNTWNDWGAFPACCPTEGYIVEYGNDPVESQVFSFGRVKTQFR